MMSKKKIEMYSFLGKDYPLEPALTHCHLGDKTRPLFIIDADAGGFVATTTSWFDRNMITPSEDRCHGSTPRAAIKALERQCIRDFKRMAKACGYEVSG